MEVVYGYQPKVYNDPFLEIAEESLRSVVIAGNPGSFLVDLIPWRSCTCHFDLGNF